MKEIDPIYQHDSEQARFDAQLAAEKRRAVESDDIKWLMNDIKGRRIVWRILDRAGVFRSSFSSDSLIMAFSEGRRNEGLALLQTINLVCPELYIKMSKEAAEDGNDRNE